MLDIEASVSERTPSPLVGTVVDIMSIVGEGNAVLSRVQLEGLLYKRAGNVVNTT
jgi:hypothetical protein